MDETGRSRRHEVTCLVDPVEQCPAGTPYSATRRSWIPSRRVLAGRKTIVGHAVDRGSVPSLRGTGPSTGQDFDDLTGSRGASPGQVKGLMSPTTVTTQTASPALKHPPGSPTTTAGPSSPCPVPRSFDNNDDIPGSIRSVVPDWPHRGRRKLLRSQLVMSAGGRSVRTDHSFNST